MTTFEQFRFRPEIMQGISDLFYKEPTPIQEVAIPLIMEGKDVIGQAQTGTGKTAAFVLPTLEKLQKDKKDIQVLILTPTRELSIQIAAEIQKLGKHLNINVLSLHGGTDIERQMNKLKENVQIVVGTPGRVLDHMRRETLHFGRIHTLVLDEADKMLEMGFLEDVEKIIVSTPSSRQVLLFSATMPDLVKKLAQRFMKQPPHIKIESKQKTVENITQEYYVINQSDKMDALLDLIEVAKPFLGIIFANTQQRVKILTARLQEAGYEARALYGDLSQNKRETLMKDFRKVKFQLLVATDIAARGLDVEGVTHVFNYDIPSDVESYIHRVGRTGRANQQGNAISFITPRQKSTMARFAKGTKAEITEKLLMHTRHLDAGRKARSGEREVHYTELRKEKAVQKQKEKAEKEAPLKEALTKNKKVKPGYKKKLKRELEEWQTQYTRNQKREEAKKAAKAAKASKGKKPAQGQNRSQGEGNQARGQGGQGGYQGQSRGQGGLGGYQGQRRGQGGLGGYQGQRRGQGGLGGYQGQRRGQGGLGGYQGQRRGQGGLGGYQGQSRGQGGQGGYQGQSRGQGGQGGYQGQSRGQGGQGGYQGQSRGQGGQGGDQGQSRGQGGQGGYQGQSRGQGGQGGYQGQSRGQAPRRGQGTGPSRNSAPNRSGKR